jgi:hypothetical protein
LPDRGIKFKKLTQACQFEQLRKKFGGDKFQAWTEYREIKYGVDSHVMNPSQYDANPLVNATKDTAGSKREKLQSFLTKQVSETNGASSMCRGIHASLSFAASSSKSPSSHLQEQGWKSKRAQESATGGCDSRYWVLRRHTGALSSRG